MSLRLGVISDTHGLIRPEALAALDGVDYIFHAGDIGGDAVLRSLRKIAPVTFVLGNNDDADGYDIVRKKIAGLRIVMTHILPRPRELRPAIRKVLDDADLVVFGHSHLPHNEVIHGIRFFNPGSAGPRRFTYPVSVGLIDGDAAVHVALDARSRTTLKRHMNQLA